MSLSNLKKNRQEILNKLKQAAETQGASGGGGSARQEDARLWRPTFDKERGVGSAVVRFLPALDGEDLPWSKVIRHAFKGPTGKWYIENSLRTISKSDPVAALNARLWNSGVESDKDVARVQKQKIEYCANVLVIKDPANPEAEGTVRLYKFGPMIFKMLEEKMFPKFDDETPMNPFDMWDGANFNIKIVGKQVGKDTVPNYEKSTFSDPSALCGGDDDEIEAIYAKCYSLLEFTDPKNFKTEDELKRKLFDVLGPIVGSGIETVEGMQAPSQSRPVDRQPTRERVVEREEDAPAPTRENAASGDDSGDDDLEFLKNLVRDL